MNAMHTVASDCADALLPTSLQRHPALVRLRACLMAQRPGRESVDAVCSRLLCQACAEADRPVHPPLPSPATPPKG